MPRRLSRGTARAQCHTSVHTPLDAAQNQVGDCLTPQSATCSRGGRRRAYTARPDWTPSAVAAACGPTPELHSSHRRTGCLPLRRVHGQAADVQPPPERAWSDVSIRTAPESPTNTFRIESTRQGSPTWKSLQVDSRDRRAENLSVPPVVPGPWRCRGSRPTGPDRGGRWRRP